MNFPKIKFDTKVNKTLVNSHDNDEKSIQRICSDIELAKVVSVFLPENSSPEALTAYSFYTIQEFKIADIFAKNFIDGYVLNGDLCCASVCNNFNNCHFVLSGRKLTLKIDRELYYSLNAVHLAKFIKKSDDKFFITFSIELSTDNACKIRNELMDENVDRVTMNFKWKPQSSDVCESSLAKFFSDMGYSLSETDVQSNRRTLYNEKIYKIPTIQKLIDESYEDWSNLLENISMLMLGCDSEALDIEKNDSKESMRIRRATVVHHKGFLTSNVIEELMMEIKGILKKQPAVPYIALSLIPYSSLQKHPISRLIFITPENIIVSE